MKSLYAAAALLVAIGIAHSFLGERYILMRLFRRDDLPKLFGDTWFTERTLRFAWHLTTIAWFGFAGILYLLAQPPVDSREIATVVAGVFLVHAAVALVASRGKHLSWIVFLSIGSLVWFGTRI